MSAKDPWGWLVRNQKYIWAGLYLAEIPAFGFAYSTMDRAFYSPNIKLERSYGKDASKIADLICEIYNHRARYKGFDLTYSSLLSSGKPIGESQPAYQEEINQVQSYKFACFPPVEVSGAYQQSLIVDAQMIDQHSSSDYFAHLEVTLFSDQIASLSVFSEPSFSDYSDETPLITPGDYKVALLIFERQESEKILGRFYRFTQGDSGFTSDVSDNLSRMIYFSAVTITTLGFGDIVPITPMARWLVTAEALSGVVLVGLFLNSLTRRRSL